MNYLMFCQDEDQPVVQNKILVKTLRFKISKHLGAQENMEILDQFQFAPNGIYNTQITQYIDYLWERYFYSVLLFNV